MVVIEVSGIDPDMNVSFIHCTHNHKTSKERANNLYPLTAAISKEWEDVKITPSNQVAQNFVESYDIIALHVRV